MCVRTDLSRDLSTPELLAQVASTKDHWVGSSSHLVPPSDSSEDGGSPRTRMRRSSSKLLRRAVSEGIAEASAWPFSSVVGMGSLGAPREPGDRDGED